MAFPWCEDKAFGLPDYSIRAFLTCQLLLGWQYYIAKGIVVPEKYKYVVFAALGIYFGKEILIRIMGTGADKSGISKIIETNFTQSDTKKNVETIKEQS